MKGFKSEQSLTSLFDKACGDCSRGLRSLCSKGANNYLKNIVKCAINTVINAENGAINLINGADYVIL